MRGVSLRLAINLAAVVLIGLAVIDVVFVFWSQSQLARHRTVELRAAALAVVLELETTPSDQLEARLAFLAAEHRADLVAVRLDRTTMGTTGLGPAVAPLGGSGRLQADGREYVMVQVPESTGFSRVVASRSLQTTIEQVLGQQRAVILFLLGVGALMTGLGLLFLRTTVVAPIIRMTRLVGSADRDGLARFGHQANDDLARLSSAIIGMTQRIDEDRLRITTQLDQLRTAHSDLQLAQKKLVRAERLAVVGQLAAGLAHEVGNPLAILSGYVDVLADGALPEATRREALVRMRRELDRIHNIIRDLLDFSRAPDRAVGQGNVAQAVAHVEKLLQPQKRMKGVALEISMGDGPLAVTMETHALTQVLLNVLLNAVDAVSGAGTIEIRAERAEGQVRITVDDSGPGIPEDVAARIFEPFFTTKPTGSGTGLGLAVCDHLVSSAGGEIFVARSPAGGARVEITLPVPGC